ncbi:hypothetical protein ACIRJS_29110 [Streptomyces sp. NPDC102340]|uniref:hypothetical protein n=1 Tax=unclassified Streptomyces TaxID=2593676 RepID=UPI003816BBFF
MTEPLPRALDVAWGAESVRVSSIAPRLAAETSEADVKKVVEAGAANPSAVLADRFWGAIGVATSHAPAVAAQVQPTATDPFGMLMTENVEGATLHSVVTRVVLSELLPGIQPRTGVEAREVDDPQVLGLAEDGRPVAALEYRYRDLAHLRNHVWETLHGTLSFNNYTTSILTRTVTRNLIVHPVEIAFEDGTPSFAALVVRDGITRLASAWAVQCGARSEPSEVADLAVRLLLGGEAEIPPGQGPGDWLAEQRRQLRERQRAEFAQEMASSEPGVRAAQIAQTFVVPAQIAVGVEGHPGSQLSVEDLFEDAVRSVLASVHVEFKQWDDAAQNLEIITRAIKRVIQLSDPRFSTAELQDIFGLATGRIPAAELPQVIGGDPQPPGTALWRAIHLTHALTRPELLDLLKDQAKAIKGGKRMSMKGFGELLGPIIDLPWRTHKKHVMRQARNAWNNGGVLTSEITDEWTPRTTDDFTTLVAPALAGDADARHTLAIAGGIALIADKLLTRNVGSALTAHKEKGGVPFRADVHLIVKGLAQQHNELGLWTLALAANTFREDALPQNTVIARSLTHKESEGTDPDPYVYFKVDLSASDKIARDSNGVPVKLYQWDVVEASDPGRARKLTLPPPRPAAASTGMTEPGDQEKTGSAATNGAEHTAPGGTAPLLPSQRAAAHRGTLRLGVQSARDALDQLLQLEPEVGAHTPVIPPDTLSDLLALLIGIQTDVENLRRKSTEPEEEALEEVMADAEG